MTKKAHFPPLCAHYPRAVKRIFMGVARLGLKAEHPLWYARLERKEAQLLGFALRAPTQFGYGASTQQNVGRLARSV